MTWVCVATGPGYVSVGGVLYPVINPNEPPARRQVEICHQWEAVTLQVPNTFEVEPADIGLVVGAVVGTALAFWLLGLGIGSVGRIIRDSMRFRNPDRED